MRVLFLCFAVLLLLVNDAVAQQHDPPVSGFPKSALTPQNVTSKSESLQKDSSKKDTMKTDSSVLLKEPSKKDLTHNESYSPRSDWKYSRVRDLPLEDDPNADLTPQNVLPKIESLEKEPPKNAISSDSSLLLKEPSKKILTQNESIFPKNDSTKSNSSKSDSWKYSSVSDLPLEDDPNVDLTPQNDLPKSESLQKDSSKNDMMGSDSSVPLIEPSKEALTHNGLIFPKNDSTISNSPKSGLKYSRVDDLPLEDNPNRDSLLNGTSANGSLKKDPPLNKKTKSDFLLVVPSESSIENDLDNDVPLTDQLLSPTSETIKAFKMRLLEEHSKTQHLQNQSGNLLKEILVSNSVVLKVQELSHNLVGEMNEVNRKLLEIHLQLENVQKQLKRCQGRLTGDVLLQIADHESNRLVKEEREPIIRYSHRNRYLKLLRDLRRKVKGEIQKITRLVEDTTTTMKPTPGMFPTLPW
ncbi:protein Hook homolog 3 [Drosophila suzukii]|uniref:Protein Hook homolog 3 n=1 Tax=Drosophila suzukii TaxID=28584 RepID=A0AB39Z3Y7_DROSZ